jgi:hypothetical protein
MSATVVASNNANIDEILEKAFSNLNLCSSPSKVKSLPVDVPVYITELNSESLTRNYKETRRVLKFRDLFCVRAIDIVSTPKLIDSLQSKKSIPTKCKSKLDNSMDIVTD